MNKYKYVHIFVVEEFKFCSRIIQMFLDNEEEFDITQHLFATPFEKVYDIFQNMKNKNINLNISLYKTKHPTSLNSLNYYASYGEWIFMHSMVPVRKAIFIKNSIAKKIIWRTWGHDVGFVYYKNDFIKNFLKHILEKFWKKKVKRFRGVGIANIVDKIDISDRFGNVQMFYIPYPLKETVNIFKMDNNVKYEKTEKLNIMVGHSGYEEDKHIEIMDKLKHLKNEPVHFYLVLSYGNKIYIDYVENYIKENWEGKATIIRDFLPYEKYVELLRRMDIVILDGKRSYALGNISILIALKKKLFLNKDGLLKRAFEIEKVPFCTTEMLDNITFKELAVPLNYDKCTHTDLHYKTYRESLEKWKYMLKCLDENVAE